MNYSNLTPIDNLDIICALTGWLGGALQDDEQAETPPLQWWKEDIGMEFTDNANKVIGDVTERLTIPEMIDFVKRLAEFF